MISDTTIKSEGMNVLVKNLGMVEAERFVMLMRREPFDYTKWQESLFEGKTLEQIHNAAARHWEENQ